MTNRMQRTIARPVEVSGVGFLTGGDIHLRFLPAAAGRGIAFLRTDRLYAPPVPALIGYVVPRRRRTAIEHCGVAVEMIEHVMATLAGLQIDNCLVELDGPEPPGCDGSSLRFAEGLLSAGIVEQELPRKCCQVTHRTAVRDEAGGQSIVATPGAGLTISYTLDYGPDSPIAPQQYRLPITPESFLQELAWARTFVLEAEAQGLRAQGYGRRTTARDLLIFGAQGVIDNTLRSADECARHKILDCLGDFSLIGCDLAGCFDAHRSGHALNAELIRKVEVSRSENDGWEELARAA